jgi:hypothetical protein
MRPPLVACPACARHVRVNEPACPFCRVELPSSLREMTAPPPPSVRLSRAALYALRAGALSATTVACGGAVTTSGGNEDSGHRDSASIADVARGEPPPDANFAVPYGLPPLPDAGSSGIPAPDASAPDASQHDAAPKDAEGRDVVLMFPPPPYGAPPAGL